MEDKWIRLADEADYNLSEIMRVRNCSLEEAQEIAEEWFSERVPEKTTIYSPDSVLDTKRKPEEVMNFDKKYSMEKIVSLIDSLKEMKSQNNIESIFIDKDSSVTIKF